MYSVTARNPVLRPRSTLTGSRTPLRSWGSGMEADAEASNYSLLTSRSKGESSVSGGDYNRPGMYSGMHAYEKDLPCNMTKEDVARQRAYLKLSKNTFSGRAL